MRAIIVEDEALAARNLSAILEGFPGIEVIANLESIAETVEWFSLNSQPDLSSFEIFDRTVVRCPVIFTTAYDEYALRAFKVNSIDYLLKPIDSADVGRALRKFESLSPSGNIQDAVNSLMASFRKTSAYKTHFLIPAKGDKLIPVQTNDLACFYIDTGIIIAVSLDEKKYRFDKTLDELADMLDPDDFFRANRQFIISRKAIKDIDIWFNSRLSVNLTVNVPEKILISKARIPEFKKWSGGI